MSKKIKRRIKLSKREEYSKRVQKYLKENAFIIMQRIYSLPNDDVALTNQICMEILGDDFPRLSGTKRTDYKEQFISLFNEVGYTCYKKCAIYFSKNDLCRKIAKNHLKCSGNCVLQKLATSCDEYHGRLSYEQIQLILGFNNLKIKYKNGKYKKECILIFLKEMKIPFVHDNKHVYFP